MTISKDLFLALLAMDAYNRGYDQGVSGLSDAQPLSYANPTAQNSSQAAQSVGFYAIAYDVGSGVDGIPVGTKVISYRGTDAAVDVVTGWLDTFALPVPQVMLATQFYQDVSGHVLADGKQGNVVLTGHSLGGGLAGIISLLVLITTLLAY